MACSVKFSQLSCIQSYACWRLRHSYFCCCWDDNNLVAPNPHIRTLSWSRRELLRDNSNWICWSGEWLHRAYVEFKRWCSIYRGFMIHQNEKMCKMSMWIVATGVLAHHSLPCIYVDMLWKNYYESFIASVTKIWPTCWGVALRCKGMCTWRESWYKANMLSCGSLPQVLWHWWIICHAAAVILSVYDRCQIKFIFLWKLHLNHLIVHFSMQCQGAAWS